jgi:hypothetical protein
MVDVILVGPFVPMVPVFVLIVFTHHVHVARFHRFAGCPHLP